jgi:hypothetical protein
MERKRVLRISDPPKVPRGDTRGLRGTVRVSDLAAQIPDCSCNRKPRMSWHVICASSSFQKQVGLYWYLVISCLLYEDISELACASCCVQRTATPSVHSQTHTRLIHSAILRVVAPSTSRRDPPHTHTHRHTRMRARVCSRVHDAPSAQRANGTHIPIHTYIHTNTHTVTICVRA